MGIRELQGPQGLSPSSFLVPTAGGKEASGELRIDTLVLTIGEERSRGTCTTALHLASPPLMACSQIECKNKCEIISSMQMKHPRGWHQIQWIEDPSIHGHVNQSVGTEIITQERNKHLIFIPPLNYFVTLLYQLCKGSTDVCTDNNCSVAETEKLFIKMSFK